MAMVAVQLVTDLVDCAAVLRRDVRCQEKRTW
jgi:hypothetical protein